MNRLQLVINTIHDNIPLTPVAQKIIERDDPLAPAELFSIWAKNPRDLLAAAFYIAEDKEHILDLGEGSIDLVAESANSDSSNPSIHATKEGGFLDGFVVCMAIKFMMREGSVARNYIVEDLQDDNQVSLERLKRYLSTVTQPKNFPLDSDDENHEKFHAMCSEVSQTLKLLHAIESLKKGQAPTMDPEISSIDEVPEYVHELLREIDDLLTQSPVAGETAMWLAKTRSKSPPHNLNNKYYGSVRDLVISKHITHELIFENLRETAPHRMSNSLSVGAMLTNDETLRPQFRAQADSLRELALISSKAAADALISVMNEDDINDGYASVVENMYDLGIKNNCPKSEILKTVQSSLAIIPLKLRMNSEIVDDSGLLSSVRFNEDAAADLLKAFYADRPNDSALLRSAANRQKATQWQATVIGKAFPTRMKVVSSGLEP